MRSEPARLSEISLDFAAIPPGWDENFPYEHAQVGQPGKVGSVFLNQFCFVFQMLIKYKNICSTWWLYVIVYCKNYLIKQSFPSDITKFFIELR